MSLRFTSQLCIDNLPDEQLNNQFEVVMPEINLVPLQRTGNNLGIFSKDIYNYQPIVEEITFGHKNFALDTRRIRTGWYGVPKDIEKIHDVKITMFCPASMETQYYLEAWRRKIFNEEGEYYYPGEYYKKNIEVYMYGPGGVGLKNIFGLEKFHLTLQGCFPFAEKDFEFEYTDDPKRFRILATFNVDNIKIDRSTIKQAIIEGVTASPTSVLDKILTGEDTSEYTTGGTYGGPEGKAGSTTSAWSKIKNTFSFN